MFSFGSFPDFFLQVELVQKMIDGVNTLWEEDKELVTKHAA